MSRGLLGQRSALHQQEQTSYSRIWQRRCPFQTHSATKGARHRRTHRVWFHEPFVMNLSSGGLSFSFQMWSHGHVRFAKFTSLCLDSERLPGCMLSFNKLST